MESMMEPDFGESLAITALSLARGFAAGNTLWCVAPEWPEHARHVAVEFVHPVLVGKRALPAVSLDVADPVAALRTLVRAGDVVLVISDRRRRRGRVDHPPCGCVGCVDHLDGVWSAPTARCGRSCRVGRHRPR